MNMQRLIKYLEKVERDIAKIEIEINKQMQNYRYKDFERDTELEGQITNDLREEKR